ncbi:MAG: DUF177 domain-containing protein, partial [Thermonemataceae bacterium]|nr:DUF177 domain-containing protein [Thermonemataceae bacterium]
GLMELVCDRSLEIFGYPFQTEGLQLLRFSDHSEQLSEELELIPKGTSQINVAYYIFELITLAIPMKKLHPRFQQEQTNDNEAMLLVYSSEKKEDKKTTDTKNIDPRWEELKKLIDNKS